MAQACVCPLQTSLDTLRWLIGEPDSVLEVKGIDRSQGAKIVRCMTANSTLYEIMAAYLEEADRELLVYLGSDPEPELIMNRLGLHYLIQNLGHIVQ